MSKVGISPIRGLKTVESPWEGNCARKPWDYTVSAAIPVLDTFDMLELCVDCIRYQTERPYIMVIDTGSCDEELEKVYSLQAEDLEVHAIRMNGTRHPSDYPAMAMDLAFTLCRTPYLFATHADCFLRRRNFISHMLDLCQNKSPVVGYEMSPRAHSDWKGMVSHTASMYHMVSMDKLGFGWSLRRLCNIHDIPDYKPNPMRPNWPDTEILGNVILRANGVKPLLIGKEDNFSRNRDENIDHCRSITSGRLYSPDYVEHTKQWLEEARNEALERIAAWKSAAESEQKELQSAKQPDETEN